jgi:glycopeptide antibiotics resistance protein
MPIIANILLFVPWGFLMFLVLDGKTRSRRWTYGATVIGAVAFAAGLLLWQQSLPTRVTSLPDMVANGLGALAGAALGHARKGVHVRFDF